MIGKTQYGLSLATIEKLSSVFRSYPQIEKVVLYGSRAIGNYRAASDIDLTIIGATVDLSLLFKVEDEIEDLMLPYKVDLSLMSKIDNPSLIDHIHRVGVLFYEK